MDRKLPAERQHGRITALAVCHLPGQISQLLSAVSQQHPSCGRVSSVSKGCADLALQDFSGDAQLVCQHLLGSGPCLEVADLAACRCDLLIGQTVADRLDYAFDIIAGLYVVKVERRAFIDTFGVGVAQGLALQDFVSLLLAGHASAVLGDPKALCIVAQALGRLADDSLELLVSRQLGCIFGVLQKLRFCLPCR